MRLLPRVPAFTALALAGLLVLLSVPAIAEEEPAPAPVPTPTEEAEPAPAPKPDPKIPGYSIEFLMPTEANTPEGWKLGGAAPTGAPTEDGLTEIAETCKLDDETFYVETGVLSQDGDKVGFAMIDIDKNVYAFRAKLDAQATVGSWRVHELGSPARVVVIGGEQGLLASAAKALTEHVVYAMAELGMSRVGGRRGHEEASREAALAYTQAMRGIASESGVANAIVGVVHWYRSQPKKRGEKPDIEIQNDALAAFEKALAEGVTYPPKGHLRVFVAGQLGSILLARHQKNTLAKATRALEIAVKHEQDGKNNTRRFGSRYDLACAYARAGKIDEAFAMLEKSIQTGANLGPAEWAGHYKHISEKDPDMDPLRKDPRFSKLMADNKPPEPKKRNPHGGAPPKKPEGKKPADH